MAVRLSKPSQRWAVVIAALAMLAGVSPLLVGRIAELIPFPLTPDRERDESSGVVRIFRGLQMSLADICYAKSTHYQHRGILYQILDEDILGEEINKEQNQLTEGADKATSPTSAAAKPDEPAKPGASPNGHTHEGQTAEEHKHAGPRITEIPTRARDFRGIIGEVERKVKPFELGHVEHTQPIEALPWLRLATWINPGHEKAWVATAFWLKGTSRRNPRATSQAIALLEQAVALNRPRPDQPYEKQGLVYMLGNLYLIESNNPAKALALLEPVLKQGEKDFAQLGEVQRDWLTFNFRNAALACRKLNQHEEAIEICRRGIALIFPVEDKPLKQILRREQQLLKKARETKPPISPKDKPA